MHLHLCISHKIIMKIQTLCFFFFLFFMQSLCLDPRYESCVPKNCGDGVNIRYPFYIKDLQDPSCGYPGFEVHCSSNSNSILTISGSDFVIKSIDYPNSAFRLQNVAILNESCPLQSKIRNLTVDNRFRDFSTAMNLVLIYNCSGERDLPVDLERYKIQSCEKSRQEVLVMLENDRNFRNVTKYCNDDSGVIVSTPVELNDGEEVDGQNYAEVVERGFVVGWAAPDCSICERSGGRCGFNSTRLHFNCFCRDRPHRVSCMTERRNKTPMILVTVFSVGAGVMILGVITLCHVRKLKWRRNIKYINVENFLANHEFLAPKRYSCSQLKKMTDSFRVKLGQGGFGSVYRGALSNGNLVAVKVLSESKGDGEDFINEVASVGRTCHVNIVSLVGFCFEGHQRALIYEFMPNGSLEKFIYDQASSSNTQLGWEKLHHIAVGIARGLEYLHSGCSTRILHLDIKPHNILLDQDFVPKISDFGLAKLFPEKRSKISMSCMRGTPGYIAPELFSRTFGQVSQKSDVYSYGMMILEMVGGRKNIEVEVDHTSETYFPHWIYKMVILDEELGLQRVVSDEEDEIARKMIIVGLWCIQTNPLSRPTISKVLEMLEGDLTSLEIPPKPYLSSPPRSIASSSLD